MAAESPLRNVFRNPLRKLGASVGLATAPFIYAAVVGGEHATHGKTPGRQTQIRLVDYQTPTIEGATVYSRTAAAMSSKNNGNPLSDAPWYDKVAVFALIEGIGATALAGQKRTHEASKVPTRWAAYTGTGLGIAAANVLAASVLTGHI